MNQNYFTKHLHVWARLQHFLHGACLDTPNPTCFTCLLYRRWWWHQRFTTHSGAISSPSRKTSRRSNMQQLRFQQTTFSLSEHTRGTQGSAVARRSKMLRLLSFGTRRSHCRNGHGECRRRQAKGHRLRRTQLGQVSDLEISDESMKVATLELGDQGQT
jgi:hypothetical protein